MKGRCPKWNILYLHNNMWQNVKKNTIRVLSRYAERCKVWFSWVNAFQACDLVKVYHVCQKIKFETKVFLQSSEYRSKLSRGNWEMEVAFQVNTRLRIVEMVLIARCILFVSLSNKKKTKMKEVVNVWFDKHFVKSADISDGGGNKPLASDFDFINRRDGRRGSR